jgi:hypothetical protein
MPDGEADVGPRQRVAAHRLDAMCELGAIALQELAPRRRGEEQLAHFDRGAGAAGHRRQLAAARVQAQRLRRAGRAAGQRQLGHRGDRGQRLAAKAHRRDALQVVERADLAGGMAAQREREFFARDAGAVVLDHDAAHTTA